MKHFRVIRQHRLRYWLLMADGIWKCALLKWNIFSEKESEKQWHENVLNVCWMSFCFVYFVVCYFLLFLILQWFDDRMFSDLWVKFTHLKLHLNSSHAHTHTHFGFIRCLNNLCEFETELDFRMFSSLPIDDCCVFSVWYFVLFFDLFLYPILFSVRTCIECVTI